MKSTNKAFTLVELIIVIAVIGVLAAILIPVFANVIEKANKSSALSDAKNALEAYLAETIDATGGIPVGEGSVFKIRKTEKDWYFTFYENALHEGTGAGNADALRPIPAPAGSVKCMSANSYYIAEQDAQTQIYDSIPDTVIIYNTGENATYTPPTEDLVMDGEFIVITRADQLTYSFFSEHGFGSKYKLGKNITLSGSFTPIEGEFSGEFNGNGKTISHLSINQPGMIGVGLFRTVSGADMYNFTLGVDSILGECKVGSVCGTSYNTRFTDIHVNIAGTISDAHIDGTSNDSSDCVGGFCSLGGSLTVSRCSVKGSVQGAGWDVTTLAGGMFSTFGGTMTECFFKGSLGGSAWVGGLAACTSSAVIENCYASVSFSSAADYGGICGFSINDTVNRIRNCVCICNGFNHDDSAGTARAAAVIIGYLQTCEVSYCYALSDNPLTEHPWYSPEMSENGTLVSAFTSANCPSLNALDTLWSFAGGYPTLVNNPE